MTGTNAPKYDWVDFLCCLENADGPSSENTVRWSAAAMNVAFVTVTVSVTVSVTG